MRFCVILLLLLLFVTSGCHRESAEAKYDRLRKEAAAFKEEKKLEEARIKLRSAVDLKPKDPAAYLELGEVLGGLGQFGGALENFQTVINLDPENHKARLSVAGMLLAGKQIEGAETHINYLLEKDPRDVDALILRAMARTAIGKRDDARKILEPLIAEHPDNGSAKASLAYLNLVDGKIKEAEELFLDVLKSEPENGPVRMALADVYVREGRLDEAQQSIESLVKSYPDQSSLRYSLGEFLLRRGKGDEAFEQYRETLDKDPLRHDARDRLFDFYILRKEVDKARELVAGLEKVKPDDAVLNYFRGRLSELDGGQERALEYYLKTLAGTSKFAPAFRRAGLIEIRLGKRREGIEHLNQAISINTNDVGARIALAQDAFARHEYGEAKQHLTAVLQQYPRQVAANVMMADIALVEGNTTQARKMFDALVQLFPDNPSGYLKLAILEEKENHPDKAIEQYRKVLGFDRSVAFALDRLVQLLAHRDGIDKTLAEIAALKENSTNSKAEYDVALAALTMETKSPDSEKRARELLNEAIATQPNLMGAYLALARLDGIHGDLNAAKKNYEKLVELNPKQVSFSMLLAIIHERLGEPKKAADLYNKILTQEPRFGPAANNLAWLMVDTLNANLDQALELAKVAKEVMPDEASVTDTLGWIYFKKGAARAALPFLQEAVSLETNARGESHVNPTILYHLGEAQVAVDDKDGAKKSLESALAIAGAGTFSKRERVEELLKQLR